MGLMDVAGMVLGGRGGARGMIELFRENAEAGAERGAALRQQALAQFAAEFAKAPTSRFDRIMDGLNRLPRPAMAIGTLALFVSAMSDPVWFAARMQGIALVPEPLWWLLGVVVSFYFGARHQRKSQDFQRDMATTLARVPQVMGNLDALQALRADTVGVADTQGEAELTLKATRPDDNPALSEWKARRKRG
ncbi:MAG: holin family protein [Marinibacterium sp.]|nr:holin family protein [Marinibacterium sp.]